MPIAELKKELRTRGVFISASEYEGFGLTIIEAMAAGCLILCRDIPPLNEFVRHGSNGYLLQFDGGMTDEECLRRLLNMTPFELGKCSIISREIASRYDWKIAAKNFADLYVQVIGR